MNQPKSTTQIGMGFGFESPHRGDKDVWLTPPSLLAHLGEFDLDPCFLPDAERPWDTAKWHFTEREDGLKTPWGGAEVRVWLNPPYGPQTGAWLQKLIRHGNGLALVYVRTETRWFQSTAPCASAFLFLAKRLKFHHADGRQGGCATNASVLMAFDNAASQGANAASLASLAHLGLFVPGNAAQVDATAPKMEAEILWQGARIAGCQSVNHTQCAPYEDSADGLWQCPECERRFCLQEGTANGEEMCDACWSRLVWANSIKGGFCKNQ